MAGSSPFIIPELVDYRGMTHPGGILYPGEYRGDRVGSCRRSMHSLPHPLTLYWEPGWASNAKVYSSMISAPHIGVVPKGKYQHAANQEWLSCCTFQDQEEGKGASF